MKTELYEPIILKLTANYQNPGEMEQPSEGTNPSDTFYLEFLDPRTVR